MASLRDLLHEVTAHKIKDLQLGMREFDAIMGWDRKPSSRWSLAAGLEYRLGNWRHDPPRLSPLVTSFGLSQPSALRSTSHAQSSSTSHAKAVLTFGFLL